MNQLTPKNLSAKALQDWLEKSTPKPILIDVREQDELSIAPFPSAAIHCPLSQTSRWINNLPKELGTPKPIVVICHSGIRSWQFGTWLIEQGYLHEIWNLDGGIDSWSINIDPSIPRY